MVLKEFHSTCRTEESIIAFNRATGYKCVFDTLHLFGYCFNDAPLCSIRHECDTRPATDTYFE